MERRPQADLSRRQDNPADEAEWVLGESPDEHLRLIRTVVEQMSDGVLITGPDIDPPGPDIRYANPAFCRITGYSAEEVLGKTPRLLQGAMSERAVLDRVREALTNGQPFFGQIVNYRKDGQPFWMQWHIAPVRDEQQRLTHWVAIQRDVTDQMAMEQELRQTERLASIGTLAAGVAHELNNPLGAIMLASDTLNEVLDPALHADERDKILRSCISEVQTHARRAAQIVDNVLRFARRTQGRRSAEHLATLVQQAASLLRHMSEQRQIDVRMDVPETLPAVHVDASEMLQVFVNVVSNALQASPSGGKVQIIGRAEHEQVRLEVRDHGSGMTREQQQHAFDPFYSTRLQEGGTGLGLSISYSIIKNHGGTIDIESSPGAGTTVTLRLPPATQSTR